MISSPDLALNHLVSDRAYQSPFGAIFSKNKKILPNLKPTGTPLTTFLRSTQSQPASCRPIEQSVKSPAIRPARSNARICNFTRKLNRWEFFVEIRRKVSNSLNLHNRPCPAFYRYILTRSKVMSNENSKGGSPNSLWNMGQIRYFSDHFVKSSV